MVKCLVTKLNGSTDNKELLKLGELRININKSSSPSGSNRSITIGVKSSATLEIVGDGYFTDITLSQNNGKTKVINGNYNTIYVSNDVKKLSIISKYDIKSLSLIGNISEMQLIDLKYCKLISGLFITNSTLITGDIEVLKEFPNFADIIAEYSGISGDIVSLKDKIDIVRLKMSNTLVGGDISNLSKLVNLTSLSLGNTNVRVTGDLSSLSQMSKLKDATFKIASITGDLASLPSSCRLISLIGNFASVTWGNRPSTATILAIEGNVPLGNIDEMLQNQAQCQVGFTSSDAAIYKSISVKGTRTSASDAAVTALQQKGYTVSVTPA